MRTIRSGLILALSLACAHKTPRVLDLAVGDRARSGRHVALVTDGITDTSTGDVLGPAQLATRLDGVRIVFVGEDHESVESHSAQRRLIEALHDRGRQVLVGLEMLPNTAQQPLDDWAAGQSSEPELLRRLRWHKHWGFDFRLYREIFTATRDRGIRMFGVNIPRDIVTKVRKQGWKSLTPAEGAHLPREVDTTSAAAQSHRHVFRAYFGEDDGTHNALTNAAWEGMFSAQCTWDAGMAFQAAKALLNHGTPNAIMVVLIGQGHVAYGLGVQRQAALWFRGQTSSVITVPVQDEDGRPNGPVRASFAQFLWGVPTEAPSMFPRLGLGITPDKDRRGPLVTQILVGSAAHRAGARVGDRLVDVEGSAVPDAEELSYIMQGKRFGDTVSLGIWRSEKRLDVIVNLRRLP